MTEEGWEARMAARKPRRALPPDEPAPDDGTCRECFAWRRYGPGQEHFGFVWWRTCPWTCDHAHHENEMWMGASK